MKAKKGTRNSAEEGFQEKPELKAREIPTQVPKKDAKPEMMTKYIPRQMQKKGHTSNKTQKVQYRHGSTA